MQFTGACACSLGWRQETRVKALTGCFTNADGRGHLTGFSIGIGPRLGAEYDDGYQMSSGPGVSTTVNESGALGPVGRYGNFGYQNSPSGRRQSLTGGWGNAWGFGLGLSWMLNFNWR